MKTLNKNRIKGKNDLNSNFENALKTIKGYYTTKAKLLIKIVRDAEIGAYYELELISLINEVYTDLDFKKLTKDTLENHSIYDLRLAIAQCIINIAQCHQFPIGGSTCIHCKLFKGKVECDKCAYSNTIKYECSDAESPWQKLRQCVFSNVYKLDTVTRFIEDKSSMFESATNIIVTKKKDVIK